MDKIIKQIDRKEAVTEELSRFTDSYASFNRIVNSLQRKYLELKDEFTAQNEKLVEANKKLVSLTERNITVTEFLDGILNSISAGVIAVDNNGKITHFNPAAARMLELAKNEVVGYAYREVIPAGEPTHANALRTSESLKECDAVEKIVERKTGGNVYLSVSTSLIKDIDNQPVGAVEVFHDLTKIKKMEQELARLNTLAALGEMAATVAHEVRNPLAGIGGFARLLERDLDKDDPKNELVKKITQGVDNLNGTVETLLNYTRFEEMNKQDVDYQKFISDAIIQFKNDNLARIENVNFNYKPISQPGKERLMVKIDKMLFRQILFNIFTNALDAFNCQGEINIKIKAQSRIRALEKYHSRMMLAVDETVLETIIEDSGPGVSKKHIEKIFSPFYSTKPEGNGLGLAVASKIIKAHGGDIIVGNKAKGKGAVFTILLPALIQKIEGAI